MALNAYLTLKGAKTGDIRGSVIQKGREGKIAVYAFDHQVTSPMDVQTGMASGKRMHKPFVITKEIDKSSPLLHKIMAGNESLTTWELQCFKPSVGVASGGVEQMFYKIVLFNARIISTRTFMPNNRMPEHNALPQMEEITFMYEKIEWTYTEGGITALDNWRHDQ
jgi:type VI secretion system secreted protein Hcp